MTTESPPSRTTRGVLRTAIATAISDTPAAAHDADALEHRDKPGAIVRDNADMFRRFIAGEIPADSPAFRWCARQWGMATHPAILAVMPREARRRVRDEHKRKRDYAADCHLRNVRAYSRLHRRGVVTVEEVERVAADDRYLREASAAYRRARDQIAPQKPAMGARSRERRARRPRAHANRSSARSGDSGSSDPDDPEPPSGRFCAGCGCDISHRRADARTCGAACRKRVERGVGLEQILAERQSKWRDAARDGGCRDLTYAVDRDLAELYATPQPETARVVRARRNELDLLADARWVMETNGVAITMRHHGSPWRHERHALLTRPAEVVV